MERIKNLLRQPEFPVILFVFGGIAFLRPVFLMLGAAPPQTVMRAVYFPWIVITVALVFIGRTTFSIPVSQDTAQDEEVLDD